MEDVHQHRLLGTNQILPVVTHVSHQTLCGQNCKSGTYTYILYSIYTTLILHLEDRQLLRMRGSKVVAACIFNQLHVFLCIIKTPETQKPLVFSKADRFPSPNMDKLTVTPSMIVLALTTPVSRVTISCSCVARFLSSIFSRHKIPLERACNGPVEIHLNFLIQVVCNI